jgi:formylglycine-generating enzyme required for sulfatase activity
LVLIPAGDFVMGSPPGEAQRGLDEGPQHRVTITEPYLLGLFPVTQAEYEAVMAANPARFKKRQGGGPKHPVEQVSWEDAMEFCRRLSAQRVEKEAGRVYTLPTEAEWEYACRAGTMTPFSFGEWLSSEQANFDGNHPYGPAGRGPHLQRTTTVGSYPDWYDEAYYARSPGNDPQGPSKSERGLRVLRGGSWNNSGHLCRSARRTRYAPTFRNDNIGFRVLLRLRD